MCACSPNPNDPIALCAAATACRCLYAAASMLPVLAIAAASAPLARCKCRTRLWSLRPGLCDGRVRGSAGGKPSSSGQLRPCKRPDAALAAIAAPHALARQGPWRCSTPRHGACRAGAARRSSAYRPGCVGARCMPVACVLPARCTHAARRCLLVYYARASMLLRVYALSLIHI